MTTMKQMQAAAKWDTGMDKPEAKPPVAGSATGSANASNTKDALKKELARIIDAAFTAGFDADNAGALDHFDGFALADAAIEQYWPNADFRRGEPGRDNSTCGRIAVACKEWLDDT